MDRRRITRGLLTAALVVASVACTRPPVAPEPPVADGAVGAESKNSLENTLPVGALQQFGGRGEVRIADRPGGPVLQVELARSPAEREQGLMYRRTLADDAGMLFFMPERRSWQFWMRNTLIPLDMIFVDEDWRVAGVVARAAPLTETGRGVPEPSRYVLELGGGRAEALHISKGTHLEFRALPTAPGQP